MTDDRRLIDDIDDEITDHIERRVAELRLAGLRDQDARAQAAQEFGNVQEAKETMLRIGARIERRRGRPWTGLGRDVRTAFRRLAGRPGQTATTILTLAFAIGIAASVFSIVDQLILRPPPFLHADRLVDAWHRRGPEETGGGRFRVTEIADWQEQRAVFERFETYAPVRFDMAVDGKPMPVAARVVSLGLFDMLGIEPFIGRAFTAADGAPGSEKVAMLGYSFWRARYRGSPEALGSRILLNDEPYTVIGVLPRNTMIMTDDEPIWLPINLRAWGEQAPVYYFRGIGRLAPGMDVAEAQKAADRPAADLTQRFPTRRGWYLMLLKKTAAGVPDSSRRVLFVLLGGVSLLLLMACVNAASLALGQLRKRVREIELCAAIGASRWRLMREVLVQLLLTATLAGAAAVAVAHAALEVLLGLAPERFVYDPTRLAEIDLRILAIMAGATLGVGLATGFIPALRSSRVDLARSLRDSMRGSERGGTFGSGVGWLIVIEVALAVVLLVGAAIMSRTMSSYYAIDPGFDVAKLLTVHLELPTNRYPNEEARRQFFAELDGRLRTHTGIEGSAYAWGVPPESGWGAGTPETEAGFRLDEIYYPVNAVLSPGYFAATGTPIVEGRPFTESDTQEQVILSEAFARRLWPNGPAAGRRFREAEGDVWLTVVGVAGNVEARIDEARTPLHLYMPLLMFPPEKLPPDVVRMPRDYVRQELIVRAAAPAAAGEIVRKEIAAIDALQPLGTVSLGTDIYAAPLAQQQFLLTVMGSLSMIALLLAATGIFGVLSQAVTQRRREIGVRVALGAGHGRLIRMLVGRGLVLALIGVMLGTAAALAGVRTLESLLFGISPFDPVSFVSVAVLMLAVALVACWWPTRRALAVEPAEVLRSE